MAYPLEHSPSRSAKAFWGEADRRSQRSAHGAEWHMYSPEVLAHFQNPRNAGELAGATARVEVTNPVCGDVLELAARVENGVIREVRFKCAGCVPAMACGSLLTTLMKGRTPAELEEISDLRISEAMGGLPPASRHAAQLAVDALRALLGRLHE